MTRIKVDCSGMLWLTLCCLIACLTISDAVGFEVGPILKKVQTHYNALDTLKAEFEQTSFQAMLQETVIEKGWLAIDKPDRMIWTYTQPSPKVALIESGFVWLYVAPDKHLYGEHTQNYAQHLFYQLISGTIVLTDTFSISDAGTPEEPADSNQIRLKLVPRETHPTIESIIVIFGPDFLIRQTSVFDHFGNTTTCSLSGYTLNPNLPETTFHLEISRPVTITDFTGQKLEESIISQSKAITLK
ncbi:outer membrane lipoprotein carrier protein LolA [bacterium]|nr:outer membrane lipoprotein carrier protein LolA [bacterium]